MDIAVGIGFWGFPWGWLGFSQTQFTSLIQMASLTGVLGISFLVAWVTGFFFREWKNGNKTNQSLSPGGFRLFILWGSFCFCFMGKPKNQVPSTPNRSISSQYIQGNIPQDMKWNPKRNSIFSKKYIRLTQSVASSHPQLICMAETAISDFFRREDFPE